jgi:hypothetical protein
MLENIRCSVIGAYMADQEPPNTAFSERQPEIIKNASFSQEIGTFRLFFLQTEGRSFVENDRPPSFDGALDGWYAPRFLGISLSYESFPFLSLSLASRQ